MLKFINKKNFSIIFLSTLLGFIPAYAKSSYQQVVYGNSQMMNPGMDWMMLILWVLVLIILVFAIGWVMALTQRRQPSSKHMKSAIKILEKRFADGELDIGEFELKKQAITE